MPKKMLGFLVFVVLGVLLILFFALWFKPWQKERTERAAEEQRVEANEARLDATAKLQADNYLGYYFLTICQEFVKVLLNDRIGHHFTSDEADYPARIEALASGKVNMIPMPVSSYVLHGAKAKDPYPGDMVLSIAASQRADAVLVSVSAFERLAELGVEVLDDPNIRIAVTPESPSMDLMLLLIDKVNFVNLRPNGPWVVPAHGSADAIQRLIRGEVPAAVGWEPDISRAMKEHPGKFVVVTSSKDFADRILDVLVVNSNYLGSNREVVVRFVRDYFSLVQDYSTPDRREELLTMMHDSPEIRKSGLTREDLDAAIRGIDFHTLGENCNEMFAVNGQQQAVMDCILYWRGLYRRLGMMGPNDLDNPRLIINSSLLTDLKNSPLASMQGTRRMFAPLTDSQWANLRPFGRVRFDPIQFSDGQAVLRPEAEQLLREKVAPDLNGVFQENRILVRGYVRGGSSTLSQERAASVKAFLVGSCGIDPNRVHAVGLGSSGQPPTRLPDEEYRRWQSRFSRVEIVLLDSDEL